MTQEISKLKSDAGALLRALGWPTPSHLRVLVVDDSESDYQLLCRKLHSTKIGSYDLELALDIESAVKLVPLVDYDVYLVDYKFPKGTGVDFMAAATSMGYLGPFILWTGIPFNPSQLKQLCESVAVGYLDKNSDAFVSDNTIRTAVMEYRKNHLDHLVVATKPNSTFHTYTKDASHEHH